MKVYLIAYYKGNFGDDLFVREILERYPNIHFYSDIDKEEYAKPFEKYNNMHISYKKKSISNMDMTPYDACVVVGGSIFVGNLPKCQERLEEYKDFAARCKKDGKSYFYMSSNFGPYETDEYYQTARELFENCTDVCFRDKYSANLFKDLNNVRYAPDIAFSLNFKGKTKIPNTVGMTMLDVTRVNGLKHKENEYYDFFENNIKKYIDDGKEIYLFSFWKDNGEEDVTDTLLQRFSEQYLSKINVVRYRGDIEQFLDIYSKMEYMMCIKFHSMVLSTLFKQNKVVISYLSKLNNVNEDLKLTKNMRNVIDIKGDTVIELEEYDKIEDEKLYEYVELSKKQFEKFDECVMQYSKNLKNDKEIMR